MSSAPRAAGPRASGPRACGPRACGPRAAYLHIPFCHRRCFYCDFPVVPLGDRADGERSASIRLYLGQLAAEIAAAPAGPPLSTVYLGGGTPSLLSPEQVGALLAALRARYGLAPGAEISLELDPASFDERRLAGYLAVGINRVSLGGQSFDDAVLASLGRRHRAADLREAIAWLAAARRRGALRSWSLDLIHGLPHPGPPAAALAAWESQLAQAVASGAPHLSIYDLIVEPGTVFERRHRRGELALPEEDLAADLMECTAARLAAAGFGHYEISNYALPGHASRHNRVYWSGAGWWGFGMGATSAPWGVRLARPRTREAWAAWLEAGQPGLAPPPPPAPGPPLEELLLVGLRRREGVNLTALAAAHGLEPAAPGQLALRLEPWIARGLLLLEGPRWRLRDPEGLALSNAVLREILAWWQERSAGC
ncbi:MAG: coproporphyrinogen-III oxidase family protein [Cyanobium sp.]